MRSGVIVWLGAPLLVLGRGLRSTDELKNVMVTFLVLDASVKIFIKMCSVVIKILEELFHP